VEVRKQVVFRRQAAALYTVELICHVVAGAVPRNTSNTNRCLPDTLKRYRAASAGVFTSFTPFYGLHFIIAAFLAMVMRGNVLAPDGTFRNPLTYIPSPIPRWQRHWLLGTRFDHS
jgi:hypothetical protein